MRVALHQIVTFASHPFGGNPAFVLTMPDALRPEQMTGACELLGADVLAVITKPDEPEPSLNFFTAEGSHPGAGHATMAAAHVALERRAADRQALSFRLANGERRPVRHCTHGIAVNWPLMPYEETGGCDEIASALGLRPARSYVASFGYVAVFGSDIEIAKLRPDMTRVAAMDRGALIATAPGTETDIVIRVFAPAVGLPEDPVCGTAHRIIAPYWAERLGKTSLHSRHLSKRGGDLWCEVVGNTVTIAGETLKTFETKLELPE